MAVVSRIRGDLLGVECKHRQVSTAEDSERGERKEMRNKWGRKKKKKRETASGKKQSFKKEEDKFDKLMKRYLKRRGHVKLL